MPQTTLSDKNIGSLRVEVYLVSLILYMLGNFSCFCCQLLSFSKNKLFQNIVSGPLSDPDQDQCSDQCSVSPDLGLNSFKRLSAD